MDTLNLIGTSFGRLIVITEGEKRKNHRYWVCQCICGTVKEFGQTNLRAGKSTSCGCWAKELAGLTYKSKFEKHGEHKTRLYRIHKGMVSRCTKTWDNNYPRYGAKGITVHTPWIDYEVFRDWAVFNGYTDDLTLDRKDSALGYFPENCRWVPYETQTRNRRKQSKPTSSKFIGVSREKNKTQWLSSICVSGVTHRIGYFDNEVDAAKARDAFVIANTLEHKLNF